MYVFCARARAWRDDGGGGGDGGDGADGGGGGGVNAADEPVVAVELPEDLLALTASDCSGLGPAAYKRLATAGRRLRRLCVRAARRADDAAFGAVAAMPSLQHLDVDGMSDVTSDGLLNGTCAR